MKKTISIFIVIFVIVLIVVSVSLIQNGKNLASVNKENKEYQEFLGKEVYGTDIITLINKANNSNTRNEIEKDRKGYYIENDTNSIKIEVKLFSDKELVTYQMEQLQKAGLEGFIQNFNLIKFKCTNIQYHENTKKVKTIMFEQIQS